MRRAEPEPPIGGADSAAVGLWSLSTEGPAAGAVPWSTCRGGFGSSLRAEGGFCLLCLLFLILWFPEGCSALVGDFLPT